MLGGEGENMVSVVEEPHSTFLSRRPMDNIARRPRAFSPSPHTRSVQQVRVGGQGQLKQTRRVVRRLPNATACPLMAITWGTSPPRKGRGGHGVPAIRQPPAHRRGTKNRAIAGGAGANPMRPLEIPIVLVLEAFGIPLLAVAIHR